MHHTYEDGVFELIEKDVHKAFGHTGGKALLKKPTMIVVADNFTPHYKSALENGDSIVSGLAADAIYTIDPTGGIL